MGLLVLLILMRQTIAHALNVLGGFVGIENAMSSEVSPTDSEDANGADYPNISSATEPGERELFVSAASGTVFTAESDRLAFLGGSAEPENVESSEVPPTDSPAAAGGTDFTN